MVRLNQIHIVFLKSCFGPDRVNNISTVCSWHLESWQCEFETSVALLLSVWDTEHTVVSLNPPTAENNTLKALHTNM